MSATRLRKGNPWNLERLVLLFCAGDLARRVSSCWSLCLQQAFKISPGSSPLISLDLRWCFSFFPFAQTPSGRLFCFVLRGFPFRINYRKRVPRSVRWPPEKPEALPQMVSAKGSHHLTLMTHVGPTLLPTNRLCENLPGRSHSC